MTTFTDWNLRKARKHHVCSECTDYIQPGDQYWDTRWVVDGWFRSKICLPCKALLERQDGYELYELVEWVWGKYGIYEVVHDDELLAFHLRYLKGRRRREKKREDEYSKRRLDQLLGDYEAMAEIMANRLRVEVQS